MLRGLSAAALLLFLVSQASASDYFYGTFICDYVKTSNATGFQVGDQIFVAVDEGHLSWFSALGPGLDYYCDRTGDAIICPLARPEDYIGGPPKEIPNSVFDVNTKKFTRAMPMSKEQWQCKRVNILNYTGTVIPSVPQ